MTGVQHLALGLFHFWTLSSGAPPAAQAADAFSLRVLIPARKKNASSISFICVNLCDLWAKNSFLIWVAGKASVSVTN